MKKLVLVAVLAVSGAAFAQDAAKEVWSAKCKSCHGDDGKGKTKQGEKHKVDDLTTAEWQAKHSDEKIKKAIEEGVKGTKMKGFKDQLSAAEIDALVKHVRTLKQ